MEAVVVIIVIVALAAVAIARMWRPSAPVDAALAQSLANVDAELRRVSERLVRLEGLPAALASDSERLVRMEPVTRAVDELRVGLRELQQAARSREDLERRTAESIRRLELVIAGTQSRGAAGEHLLDSIFSRLPVEWQVRNFRVGNRVVEFGLRLPNDLVLPIDSKWTATDLVERLVATEEPEQRAALKRQIESAVLERARDVTKYLEPSLTAPFGVAVVPDAVFDLCAALQVETFRMHVVLVSHSLFVPYLLVVFQSVLASGRSVDAEKLEAYLQTAASSLDAMQGELQGRFSRAVTMLTNTREEMGAQLSRARGGLAGLRVASGREDIEAIPAPSTALLRPSDDE